MQLLEVAKSLVEGHHLYALLENLELVECHVFILYQRLIHLSLYHLQILVKVILVLGVQVQLLQSHKVKQQFFEFRNLDDGIVII